MIVREENGRLLLITQPDHARFAGQLLSLWRLPELAAHPRRRLLIAAVAEHDNGWREADAAPRIDPATGRPYDFRSLPGKHRREIWRRGVERLAEREPYTALLAAQHSRELHRDRRSAPGWDRFLRELDDRRAELLAMAPVDEAELAADYRWLELADSLSLAVCCRSAEPVLHRRLSARMRGDELEIEPFPLAGVTTFHIPVRWIADRRYDGEAALAAALGEARWERLGIRCRPSSGGTRPANRRPAP